MAQNIVRVSPDGEELPVIDTPTKSALAKLEVINYIIKIHRVPPPVWELKVLKYINFFRNRKWLIVIAITASKAFVNIEICEYT